MWFHCRLCWFLSWVLAVCILCILYTLEGFWNRWAVGKKIRAKEKRKYPLSINIKQYRLIPHLRHRLCLGFMSALYYYPAGQTVVWSYHSRTHPKHLIKLPDLTDGRTKWCARKLLGPGDRWPTSYTFYSTEIKGSMLPGVPAGPITGKFRPYVLDNIKFLLRIRIILIL